MPLTADINIKNSALELGQMIIEQNISLKGAIDLGKNFLSIFSIEQNIPKVVSERTNFQYIGEAIQGGIISQF